MRTKTPLEQAIAVVEELTLEEQETLIEILHRRVLAARQDGLAEESRKAQMELRAGQTRTITPEALRREIES